MLTSNTQDPAPVKQITTVDKNIIGFHIDNEPTKADYIFMNNLLTTHLTDKENLRLLLKLEDMLDIEINYLFNEFKTTFDFYKKKTKVAVLANEQVKGQLNNKELTKLAVEFKYFPVSQEEEATSWLLETNKKE